MLISSLIGLHLVSSLSQLLILSNEGSDCLATATFGKSKRMVAAGKDDGSIHAVHNARKYMHVVGYFPLVAQDGRLVWPPRRIYSMARNKVRTLLPFVVKDRTSTAEAANPFAVRYFLSQKFKMHPIGIIHSSIVNRFALRSSEP